MKNVALVLAGLVLGAASGALLTGQVMAQSAPRAAAPPQKWQQFCEAAPTLPEASSIAGARGNDGWELVSYAGGAMCFKRPAPPRADVAWPGY